MTVPPTPPPRRSALRWAIVAAVVVVVLLVPLLLLRSASSVLGRFGQPSEPNITQQTVVEKLREVAKLVATEMTLRDVVIYEQTRLMSTKKVLLVVTGKVSAGIDMEHGTEVRIDSTDKRITVTLPPAQILSVDVLNVTTYDERAGLLNPFTPEDRDLIQRRIRGQLMAAARQSGILEHADQSAAKVLTELLGRDGYTVEIRRPIVVSPPTG
ncbi:MAG TPA: DUF4230 domain-containing protein [Gemmatimonadaceae bacterium]|nr:DUF4230 domain-containing protein [Gemmatimonadaceae bacterium]